MVRGIEMNKYAWLIKLLPIIYPKFYTVKDKNSNELVFLDCGERLHTIDTNDKTASESLENHIHLFDCSREHNVEKVIMIGSAISQNLLSTLNNQFPAKKFVVFLQVKKKRFSYNSFSPIMG